MRQHGMSRNFPVRKNIRLKNFDYSQQGAYFVTICTQFRQCLFGEVIVGAVRERPENSHELQSLDDHFLLVNNQIGRIVERCWNWLSQQYEYVGLGPYVVMPNHIHGIIFIDHKNKIFVPPTGFTYPMGRSRTAPTKTLGRLIGAFKTVSTKQINLLRKTPALSLWQRNYHEHIIRNEKDYERICEYIINNPLQWAFDKENPNLR